MRNAFKSLRDRFRYDDREMPFLEHLEDFRKTIIRSAIALTLGFLICLPFANQLVMLLRAPAEPYIEKEMSDALNESSLRIRIPTDAIVEDAVVNDADGRRFYEVDADVKVPEDDARRGVIRLQFLEPAAAFKMWMSAAFFGGLLISLPFLVMIIGSFVLPGVKDTERKLMTRIALFSGVLFLGGVAMGYKITLPLALEIMLKFGYALGGESNWFYNKYIAFALHLLLGFGLAFQLPIVILILGKMGLVSSQQLREKRRHVIVGLLVVAMLLTPPDVMTQLLMAGPLILLYEFCIWFLYFSDRKAAQNGTEHLNKE